MIKGIILFLDSLGGGELLLIFVVVLLFFGSKSIPGIAKGMGKATREFRNAMNDVRSEMETSMNVEEKKPLQQKAEEKITDPDINSSNISPEYKAPERKIFGQDDEKK
ncbi:MAG TPA: twin-arginine translocase TatA/TatE family subunit [Bacteroidia bacterium]|nr:twin-arginine translocase TatA/TatE family subunit [Bacteroidia bacterium]